MKAITEDILLDAKTRLSEISSQVSALKEEETRIRIYLADQLYRAEEGSKTVEVFNHKVTVKHNPYRSISKDDVERLEADHPEEARDILGYSVRVKEGGYKKHREVADDYITTKFGTPTITFK